MDIKYELSRIIHERMKTISELDALRFMIETKGNFNESLINILLDKLNNLNKLEKELNDQLKKKKKNQ
jgi:hypothetical protein